MFNIKFIFQCSVAVLRHFCSLYRPPLSLDVLFSFFVTAILHKEDCKVIPLFGMTLSSSDLVPLMHFRPEFFLKMRVVIYRCLQGIRID